MALLLDRVCVPRSTQNAVNDVALQWIPRYCVLLVEITKGVNRAPIVMYNRSIQTHELKR